jgi:hypothetical protein
MAGMYVSWGDFDFATHEAGIGLKIDVAYSDRGFPMHSDVKFTIDGELCEAGVDATNDRLQEIQDAFHLNYRDIAYRKSDGTPSVHSLANNDPNNMTGNHILYKSFPQTINGEFVSGRKFEIGVGARLKLDGFTSVLKYQDSLKFMGNAGPQWAWFRDRWFGYYAERISPNSMQMIKHSGRKVTSNTWHFPPSPFFQPPFEDNNHRVITLGSPRIYPNGMTEFTTEWEYSYRLPFSADFLRPRTGFL